MVRFKTRKMKRTMAMITMAAMVCSIPVMPTEKTEPIKVMAETDTQEKCGLSIDVNFKNEIATVKPEDNEWESDVLYYAVTTKDKIAKNSYPKDSAYEAVYIGEAKDIKIDLSNIPMKKEQVLCVTDCATISEKIPATASLPQQKTLVAKYVGALDPDKDSGSYIGNSTIGYITFSEKEDKDKVVPASAVQFRTINGDWKKADTDLLQAMTLATAKGANFQMRIAPTDSTPADSTPAGKIINVKMSAKAKAPKVTVNYFTHTLKVSNKMEYSLDNGVNWIPFTGKEAYFKDLGWAGTEDILVYVRTAASGKKSSSKIAYVTIKKISKYPEITVAKDSDSLEAFKAAEFGSGSITAAYKTIYDKSSGVLITNGTDNMYQACIVEESVVDGLVEDDATLNLAEVTNKLSLDGKKVEGKVAIKWTKVNAQNTKSSKCATATLQTKGLEQDKNYVILYRAVDKKGTEICSPIYVAELPGVFTQAITATLDGEEVKDDTATEIAADAPVKITLAVDGKVSEKSKFTAKAWEDEKCEKSLASTKVKAVISGNELTVTPGKDCPNEFCVKIQFEGAEKVLKFSIKGEEQTE